MQYSIIALLSLVAVAFAAPVAVPERADDLVARQATPALPTEDSVMTDASGNVVAFSADSVYKAATAAGI